MTRMVKSYSMDKLVTHKLGEGDAYPEVALSEDEKIHNVKLVDMFSILSSSDNNNNNVINTNGTNSDKLHVRFPILKTEYETQGTVSDYIYAVNLPSHYMDLIQSKQLNKPNLFVLLNLFNIFKQDGHEYDPSVRQWDHNVIPYMLNKKMHLYVPGSLTTEKKNLIKNTIKKYSDDGYYFITEGLRRKSFLVKGAASFVNIVAYSSDDDMSVYANYTESGESYYIGKYPIKWLRVEVIYTGNKTTA